MGSSHGQQTIQGACVSETAVHDHGRRLNQREFRPMAEVPFRSALFVPFHSLSEYKGKGASASREGVCTLKWQSESTKQTIPKPLKIRYQDRK